MDAPPSMLFDQNALMSVHVAGDNLDEDDSREAAAEDQKRDEEIRQELNEMVQNGLADIEDLFENTDDEEENDDKVHHARLSQHVGELTTEHDFGKRLNRRNATGSMATSTPYASSQRYNQTLVQQPLSPWMQNGQNNPFTPQKFIQDKWRRQADQGPIDQDYEWDKELRLSEEDRKRFETPPRIAPAKRTTPPVDPVRQVEKAFVMSDNYLPRASGDHLASPARGLGQPGIGDLLRHENLSPQSANNRVGDLINESGNEKLKRMKQETEATISALNAQISECKEHMALIKNANSALNQEVRQYELELENGRQELNEARALSKANRADLEALKTEKHEILKENYRKEETIKQLNEQLRDMTSWRTVDQIKKQQEELVLQLKERHDREMAKMHEGMSEKNTDLERALESAKNEAELLHIRLKESDTRREALKERVSALESELALKTTNTTSDRKVEQKTHELVQIQLRLKTEEFDECKKRLLETEESLHKRSEELIRLRDELSKSVKDNVSLIDEQTKTVENCRDAHKQLTKMSGDLAQLQKDYTKSLEETTRLNGDLQTRQAENNVLKEQVKDIQKKLSETEDARSSSQRENGDLKRQLASAAADADTVKAKLQRTNDSLKSEVDDLRNKLVEADRAKTVLQETVSRLEKDVARAQKELSSAQKRGTDKATADVLKQSVDILEKQLKNKDDELKMERNRMKEMKEVEDRLHSQIRFASDENIELRDERNRLHSEIHGMKKVLKKMKKYISGNPSPSGDSGVSSENKNLQDIAAKLASMPAGDGISRDAHYVNIQELISLRDNVVRIIGEHRSDLEHKYQQQLETDRRKIISQIDGIYTRKLQQVLLKMKTNQPIPGDGR